MDVIDHLLHHTRAKGALLHQTVVDPPWALRIADAAPLALFTFLGGSGYVWFDGDTPMHLEPGDIAIARGPEHYNVTDDPSTKTQLIIHENNVATTPDGDAIENDRLGLRACDIDRGGSTVIISGTYQVTNDISQQLLQDLPRLIVVRADDIPQPLLHLLTTEITKDLPGQQMVLDRLLDFVLVATLRSWFSSIESQAPGWYQASTDPLLISALRAMHEWPDNNWTVGSLALVAGASRATFAKRFADTVGVAPMTYLAQWRIALAADLLGTTNESIEDIAREVGYSNAFALSVAFKRLKGISPSIYRKQTRDHISNSNADLQGSSHA